LKIYLAIDISLSEVRTALWAIGGQEGERTQILGLGSTEFYQDEKGLLEAIESSLKVAWSLVSPEFQLERKVEGVIFALPQYWIGQQLQAEKLSLLRHIAQKLEIKPLGFVSGAEILLSYLKKREGKFLNLVIVNIGDEWVTVTPISQGKILGSQSVERSDNIALDLEEGLSRFETETPFSPRILLLGRGDLEEIRQIVLSYPWLETKKVLFLHLPKIEIFPSRLVIETLVAEIGKEMILKKEIEFDSQEKIDSEEESLGFLRNKDVARLKSPPLPLPSLPEKGAEQEEKTPSFLSHLLAEFKKRREKLGVALAHLKKSHLTHFLVITFVSFFLILTALLAAWWYLPKAEVVLFVKPRFLEENFLLAVSPEVAVIDAENKIIPGRVLSLEIDGRKTTETKGKKNVGDKAVGEVIIYNGTEVVKTFQAGTSLQGPNKMKFLTKEEVTVASRSGSIVEGWDSGKGKVKVEAADIGADYNLAEGTEFRVSSFSSSDFIAKNEKAFSGGSSREVRVVSEKDQEQLRESLEKELLADGEVKLRELLADGEDLIGDSINSEIVLEEFDHDIGDEVDNVSLTLKLKISALSFSQDDIDVLTNKVLSGRIPEGFILGGEKELSFDFLRQEGNKAIFDFGVKASLYPQINKEEIKKKILGKRSQPVQEYLSSLSGVDDFEIRIDPRLPKYLLTLPHNKDNIKINMKIQGE